MDSSQRALLTNRKFFFKFLAENQNCSKRIAKRDYWSKCNALCINKIRLNELFKLMKSFFQISFQNFGQKLKILAKKQKIFSRMRGMNIDPIAMCYSYINGFF